MEHDLQQKVAQLVLQVIEITAFDRVCDLVGFLDRVRRDRGEILRQIPGTTAAGGPEARHDGDQVFDGPSWLHADPYSKGAMAGSIVLGMAVNVPEVALRLDPVADELLQGLHVGETPIALALPDKLAVNLDPEGAAGGRHERDGAEFLGKRREQLLRHPGRTHEPIALAAIGDRDAWL